MIYTRDDIPYLTGLHFQLNPNLLANGIFEPEEIETVYTIEGITEDGERIKLSWLEDGEKQYTSAEVDDELLRFLNDESWLITDLPEIDTTNIFEDEEDEFEWARKATNIYEPKIGDVFNVPTADNTKLRVDKIIIYSRNYEPKEVVQDTGGRWGKVKYIHTGCEIWLERYNELTHSWGTIGTPTDLGWIRYLINDNHWFPFKGSVNEQEDDLQWAKDLMSDFRDVNDVVIVTNKGQQYTSYLGAMAALDVPGAKEHLRNSRSDQDWHDNCLKMKEKGILDDAYNGDICYLMSGSYSDIHHLVRIKDKKHFIIGKTGFKPYDLNVIKEQEDEFEWARDMIKGPINIKTPNTAKTLIWTGNFSRENKAKVLEFLLKNGFEWASGSTEIKFIGEEYIGYIIDKNKSIRAWNRETLDNEGIDIDLNNPQETFKTYQEFRTDVLDDESSIDMIMGDLLIDKNTIKESEEDEFEWAREIIKQPINALVVGQTYRVKLPEEEKGIIDLMITEMDAISFRDNSRAIIFDPETSSLDSQGQREFLKDYNRTGDRTEVSHGKYLLKTGHWYPIPIEDSLFKDTI